MSEDKAYAATPFDELERQIMDVNFAKNEREWWAWREICDLRTENEKLRAALKPFAIDIGEEYDDDDWFDDFKVRDHRAAAAALNDTKSDNK